MPVDVEVLRSIPLFATLSQEDLAQVAAMTRERQYERGDLIVLEGELGGALYYVHSGLVKVFKTSPSGKEQVLRLIAAGYTFNDVPALDGGPNPASVAAMETSTVYAIRRADLLGLIRTHPDVAAVSAGRLRPAALREAVRPEPPYKARWRRQCRLRRQTCHRTVPGCLLEAFRTDKLGSEKLASSCPHRSSDKLSTNKASK
jgi:hypothetical protein